VVGIVFSRRWFVFDGLRHHFLPIDGGERMILKELARARGQPSRSIAPVFSSPLITIAQTFSMHEIGAHTICLTPAVASEGRLYLNHHRPRFDQPKNAQLEDIANDMLFNHVRSLLMRLMRVENAS
jgi:hypothetical protein